MHKIATHPLPCHLVVWIGRVADYLVIAASNGSNPTSRALVHFTVNSTSSVVLVSTPVAVLKCQKDALCHCPNAETKVSGHHARGIGGAQKSETRSMWK
mgnify:CR=1 FL=1